MPSEVFRDKEKSCHYGDFPYFRHYRSLYCLLDREPQQPGKVGLALVFQSSVAVMEVVGIAHGENTQTCVDAIQNLKSQGGMLIRSNAPATLGQGGTKGLRPRIASLGR